MMIRSRRTKPRPGRLQSEELAALRRACFDRDKGVCQECGIDTWFDHHHLLSRSFHMAHIKGKRMHGDSLDNVRTLCGGCHRKEHQWGKSMQKPVPPKQI